MLLIEYTSRFEKDLKRLKKKHVDIQPLGEVIDLIAADNEESRSALYRHHNLHRLKGQWADSYECHIANFGDWLLIWKEYNGLAVLLRTGTHDELFS